MRLCYFIAVHQKPRQLDRLLSAIHDPRDHFIVHIDARTEEPVRADFLEVVRNAGGVELLPSRPVIWGHWSLVDAHRRAISRALRQPGWQHFVNLSAACYPLKSRESILGELSASPGANYVNMDPLDQCPFQVELRFRLFYFLWRQRLVSVPAWRSPPPGTDYRWKGAAWAILSRDFCEWLDSDPLAQRISDFLRHAKNPDEFWLQWLLMSSPFRETRRGYRHFIRWRPNKAHPEILTSADIGALRAADEFFARKFDIDRDAKVLDLLDEVRSPSVK